MKFCTYRFKVWRIVARDETDLTVTLEHGPLQIQANARSVRPLSKVKQLAIERGKVNWVDISKKRGIEVSEKFLDDVEWQERCKFLRFRNNPRCRRPRLIYGTPANNACPVIHPDDLHEVLDEYYGVPMAQYFIYLNRVVKLRHEGPDKLVSVWKDNTSSIRIERNDLEPYTGQRSLFVPRSRGPTCEAIASKFGIKLNVHSPECKHHSTFSTTDGSWMPHYTDTQGVHDVECHIDFLEDCLRIIHGSPFKVGDLVLRDSTIMKVLKVEGDKCIVSSTGKPTRYTEPSANLKHLEIRPQCFTIFTDDPIAVVSELIPVGCNRYAGDYSDTTRLFVDAEGALSVGGVPGSLECSGHLAAEVFKHMYPERTAVQAKVDESLAMKVDTSSTTQSLNASITFPSFTQETSEMSETKTSRIAGFFKRWAVRSLVGIGALAVAAQISGGKTPVLQTYDTYRVVPESIVRDEMFETQIRSIKLRDNAGIEHTFVRSDEVWHSLEPFANIQNTNLGQYLDKVEDFLNLVRENDQVAASGLSTPTYWWTTFNLFWR